jgi:hypothetical protein
MIGMVEFELFPDCMRPVFLLLLVLLLLLLLAAKVALLLDCVNIMAYESETTDAMIIESRIDFDWRNGLRRSTTLDISHANFSCISAVRIVIILVGLNSI